MAKPLRKEIKPPMPKKPRLSKRDGASPAIVPLYPGVFIPPRQWPNPKHWGTAFPLEDFGEGKKE